MTTIEIRYLIQLDNGRCTACYSCLPACNFGGLLRVPDEQFIMVDPWACTGCGTCITVCPEDALGLSARGSA